MTKQELAQKVSAKTGHNATVTTETIDAMMYTIIETLQEGDNIYLRGFGTFTRKHRAKKTARNISAGTSIIVPAHDIPYFKPTFNV